LGLLGVFGNGRFNGTMQKVVGPTLVAMAMTFRLHRHGDLVAYWLVLMVFIGHQEGYLDPSVVRGIGTTD